MTVTNGCLSAVGLMGTIKFLAVAVPSYIPSSYHINAIVPENLTAFSRHRRNIAAQASLWCGFHGMKVF